jgi:hypothetical protein
MMARRRGAGSKGDEVISMSLRKLALTGAVLCALGMMSGHAVAQSAKWTKARVAKTLASTVVIKCPRAMWLRSEGSAQGAADAQAYCNNQAEPRLFRTILACGVTSRCVLDEFGRTMPVTETLLRLAEVKVQLHEKGTPAVYAKCMPGRTNTFSCGVQLATENDFDSRLLSSGRYRMCLAVNARRGALRWKVTEVWFYGENRTTRTPSACEQLATRPS